MLTHYQFIEDLKSLWFVDRILLFGSRANRINREKSDIDLAIDCPNADIMQWDLIKEIIEYGDTLLMVDVIRYDELKSDEAIKIEIDKNHVVLYERDKTKAIDTSPFSIKDRNRRYNFFSLSY